MPNRKRQLQVGKMKLWKQLTNPPKFTKGAQLYELRSFIAVSNGPCGAVACIVADEGAVVVEAANAGAPALS